MNVIAQAARNLPGHWFKGSYVSLETGNRCGLGHVKDVIYGDYSNVKSEDYETWQTAQEIMANVAGEQFPERAKITNLNGYADWSFAVFNDHPDTTEDEVVAVMEKAAVRLDEQI